MEGRRERAVLHRSRRHVNGCRHFGKSRVPSRRAQSSFPVAAVFWLCQRKPLGCDARRPTLSVCGAEYPGALHRRPELAISSEEIAVVRAGAATRRAEMLLALG